MARPLDELVRDARHAQDTDQDHLMINPTELRMLKEYAYVVGTADKRTAMLVWPMDLSGFKLLVTENGKTA